MEEASGVDESRPVRTPVDVAERSPVCGRSFGHIEERGVPSECGQPPGGVGGGRRTPQCHVVASFRRALGVGPAPCGQAIGGGQRQSHPAARYRKAGRARDECVPHLRGEVGQEPLGHPCHRCARVERRAQKGITPVLGQIDGHRDPLAARLPSFGADHPLLERDDIGQVQLPQAGAFRPGQSKSTGVEPGPQDHDLPARPGAGLQQHVIEKAGPDSDPRDQPPPNPGRFLCRRGG